MESRRSQLRGHPHCRRSQPPQPEAEKRWPRCSHAGNFGRARQAEWLTYASDSVTAFRTLATNRSDIVTLAIET